MASFDPNLIPDTASATAAANTAIPQDVVGDNPNYQTRATAVGEGTPETPARFGVGEVRVGKATGLQQATDLGNQSLNGSLSNAGQQPQQSQATKEQLMQTLVQTQQMQIQMMQD